MRAWSFAFNNQFRMDACRKLGIHAVTAKQVGPLFDQFLRIAKDEGLDTQAKRGEGRGVAEMYSHRLQRPRGAADGSGNFALRTGSRPARRAGARKQGAAQPALRGGGNPRNRRPRQRGEHHPLARHGDRSRLAARTVSRRHQKRFARPVRRAAETRFGRRAVAFSRSGAGGETH